MASAKPFTSTDSFPSKPIDKPLKNCDVITPELPRADKTMERAIFLEIVPRFVSFMPKPEDAPPSMVIFMFVPVSPSGTGNTFNALILSTSFARLLAPATIKET